VWGETVQVTEVYDWDSTLRLNNMDIVSIQSITLGWPSITQVTTIPSNGYFFNKYGRVTLLWRLLGTFEPTPFHNDYITVEYTYGNATVPQDLFEAALGFATQFYNWAIAGGHGIVASSVGSFRLEFAGAVRGANVGPTPYKDTAEAHYMTIKSYAMERV
jgi:hypothetical protein